MKTHFLILTTFFISITVFAQGLPLFDYPYPETPAAPAVPYDGNVFGPGGNLEGIKEKVSIDVSEPESGPGQPFTITATSYSTNLDKANISWYINKELVISKTGQTSYEFFTPKIGESLLIDLIIKTTGGNTIERNFSYSPAFVDLVYEAKTYTPPFYKGKAVYTKQSLAKIHALPKIIEDGITKEDKDLIYTWEVNGSVQKNQSGYGKKTFDFNGGSLSKDAQISVSVLSPTSDQVATGSVFLAPHEQEILLVQEHPLYGMYKTLDTAITTSLNDIIIHAIPLFFSTTIKESPTLKYSWALNGMELGNDNDSSIIGLQTPPGEDGTANVSVRVENELRLLQGASTRLTATIIETDTLFQDDIGDFSF